MLDNSTDWPGTLEMYLLAFKLDIGIRTLNIRMNHYYSRGKHGIGIDFDVLTVFNTYKYCRKLTISNTLINCEVDQVVLLSYSLSINQQIRINDTSHAAYHH
jgi:hypothetical protein